MEEEKRGLTRRNFVSAAVLGAGSLASVGLLSACSPQTKSDSSTSSTSSSTQASVTDLNPQEDYTKFTTDYAALFQPLKIGSLTLRNRFVKSPAGSDTWAPVNGVLNDNYLDYYENFAKGGCSLVFTEAAIAAYLSINLTAHKTTGWLGDDITKIPVLVAPVVERVHKHGAYIGYQLSAPSVSDIGKISVDDLVWIQDTMTNLAVQYKKGGYDMVEIHASATQFPNYIMTTRYNTRTDQYSVKTVENRTRWLCELIQKIKAACGQDFPIQILMNAVEDNDASIGDNDGYLTAAECIDNAKAFEKAGADTIYLRLSVPGLHVSQFAPDLQHSGYKCNGITGYGSRFDYSRHFSGIINGQYSGCAMLLKAAAEFKKNVSIPVSCAGYMDPRTAPDLMNNAVANGQVDYMMITRPLTVDPEMPNKLQAGKRAEVAPCCRCMHCHNKGGPEGSGPERCRVNATTQYAYTDVMPEGYNLIPATKKKKVVVVGGGPAGMEAARIAAQRGHTVTLYEKNGTLGGLLKTAHAFKGDHERLNDLIDYLTYQQQVNGVKVVTGTKVDAEVIKKESPDAVVIAVGGNRESKLSSSSTTNVVNVDGLMSATIGSKVVICGAGAQAVDTALFLLASGKNVQMVHGSTKDKIDKEQSMWVRTYVRPQLYAKGVKVWNSATVKGVGEGGLTIVTPTGTETTIKCDTVVECYDMIPNQDLYKSVSGNYETYIVGDCSVPSNIADAILNGNLAARKI